VVHRCKGDLGSNLVAEVIEHCIIKTICVVNSDVPWYAIAADDVLPKELFDLCGAYIGQGLRFHPFYEVFDCHYGEGVTALCGG
jgi:hypothetical protein